MEFPEGVRIRLYRWSGLYLGKQEDLLVVEADDFGRGSPVFANRRMPCAVEDLPEAIADALRQWAQEQLVAHGGFHAHDSPEECAVANAVFDKALAASIASARWMESGDDATAGAGKAAV